MISLESILLGSPRGLGAGVVRALRVVPWPQCMNPPPVCRRKDVLHHGRVPGDFLRHAVIFVDEVHEVPAADQAG